MAEKDLISGDVKITDTIAGVLDETARWARFLSMIGFVVVGLMVVAALILPGLLAVTFAEQEGFQPGFTAAGIRINFLILAILLFFPCMYLFRFALKMKDALENTKQDSFEESFRSLKSTFKFYGILTIVILAIYGLALIALLLTLFVAR